MRIDAISLGKNPPHEINVIIEVPVGGEPIKYEMDKDAGTLVVDRFLYTSMRYPGNYGFIPHTLSGDGDPCDVLVANTRASTVSGSLRCAAVHNAWIEYIAEPSPIRQTVRISGRPSDMPTAAGRL